MLRKIVLNVVVLALNYLGRLMKIHRGWSEATKELLSREDLDMILSSNLSVVDEPIPEGKAGKLYRVGGVGVCCEAILDLLERHIKELEERNEREEQERS